jgi:hypothetical protein
VEGNIWEATAILIQVAENGGFNFGVKKGIEKRNKKKN